MLHMLNSEHQLVSNKRHRLEWFTFRLKWQRAGRLALQTRQSSNGFRNHAGTLARFTLYTIDGTHPAIRTRKQLVLSQSGMPIPIRCALFGATHETRTRIFLVHSQGLYPIKLQPPLTITDHLAPPPRFERGHSESKSDALPLG